MKSDIWKLESPDDVHSRTAWVHGLDARAPLKLWSFYSTAKECLVMEQTVARVYNKVPTGIAYKINLTRTNERVKDEEK